MYIAAAFAAAITAGAITIAGLSFRQRKQAEKALKSPSN